MLWKVLSVTFSGLLLAAAAAGYEPSREKDIRERANRAFDRIYDLEYAAADNELAKLMGLYPDSPAGYLYLATNIWLKELARTRDLTFEKFTKMDNFMKWHRGRVDPKIEEKFRELNLRAMERAKRMLESNPRNTYALYYLGTAHSNLAAFEAGVRRKFLAAIKHGSKAYEYHKRVVDIDPTFYDSYLTIGIYDYVTGSLPSSVKWLAFLLGYRGNKERGLLEVRLAAEKGRFNKKDARVIYTVLSMREKRPLEAIRYLSELRKEHPKNYVFQLDLASIYHIIGNYQRALELYTEAMEKVRAGVPHFDKLDLELVHYRLGNLHLDMRNHQLAIDNLKRVVNAEGQTGEEVVTMAHLKLGQAYDLAKQRPQAVEHYRTVLHSSAGM